MANAHYASIDGLRGLAVLAVFAFHLELRGWEGGYLGVDIFFLISGFIVSTVTLRRIRGNSRTEPTSTPDIIGDKETEPMIPPVVVQEKKEGLDWVDFSLRRAKRLWPELYLVMTGSLVVGAKLLWEREFRRLPISSLAQVFLVSNLRFWQEAGDYFDPGAKAKPLLHTWSLSVEEQFYLFFAAALTFGYGKVSKQRALPILIGIWMGSLAGSVLCGTRTPSSVFYLLPFRAWQFLSGIIPALISNSDETIAVPKHLPEFKEYFSETMELLCLTGIFCAIGFEPFLQQISPTLPAALAIGLGAPLLLSLVTSKDSGKVTWTGRLLGLKPVVFIGEISYSIYLWHWPIICFASVAIEDDGFIVKSGLFGLTCVLASLSHHLVVSPIRSIPNSGIRGSGSLLALLLSPVLFFLFLSSLSIFAPFGRCPHFSDYDSSSEDGIEGILDLNASLSNDSQSGSRVHPTPLIRVPKQHLVNRWKCTNAMRHPAGVSNTDCYLTLGNCSKEPYSLSGISCVSGTVHALAIGDSHLLAVGGSMQELAIEENICLHFSSFSRCPPIEGQLVRDRLYSKITSNHRRRFKQAIIKFLEKFNSLTDQFIIWSQVPVRINKWQTREAYDAPFCTRETCKKYDEPAGSDLAILTKELIVEVIKDWTPRVKLIDPSPLFCHQQTCTAYVNGTLAYWDGSHLNYYGGRVVKPLLKRGFDSALSVELI